MMKQIFILAGLFGLLLLSLGCPGNNTPSSPNPPTPTPTFTSTNTPCMNSSQTPCTSTPTLTFTPTPTPTSAIGWYGASLSSSGGTTQTDGYVDLMVYGIGVNNAHVTITGPGLGGAKTPVGFQSYAGPYGSAYYDLNNGYTYQAGQSYILSATTSAGVAAVTFYAPGGPVTINSNGTTVSWAVGGNSDSVYIYQAATVIFSSATGISSPYTVPSTVYNGYASPTTFTFLVSLVDREVPSYAQTFFSTDMHQTYFPVTVIR